MKMPEVKPGNHAELSAYFEQFEINPVANRFGHSLLSKIVRPTVVPVHESAPSVIHELHDNGYRFVLAANHFSNLDPIMLASMTRHFEPLRHMEGTSFIPSKKGLFLPGLSWAIKNLGATVQFRPKDCDPELFEEIKLATTDFYVHMIGERGLNMAIYPAGTRGDRKDIGNVRKGLGHALAALPKDTKAAVIPVGMYGGEGTFSQLRPVMSIGDPMLGSFDDPDRFTALLAHNMQSALDFAVEQYTTAA